MKLKKYLKDKLYAIILFIISYLIILLIFLAFKIPQEVIIAISLILMLFFFLLLLLSQEQSGQNAPGAVTGHGIRKRHGR